MPLELLDVFDVSSQYTRDVEDSAAINDVFGLIVKERVYKINDSQNDFNPFAPGSPFSGVWRNGRIKETDKNAQIIYDAAINDVSFSWSEKGKQTEVYARDAFGVLKEWVVEELALKSEIGMADFYVSAAGRPQQFNGSFTLSATGTPPDIAVGDIVSFNPSIVPRYSVVSVTGSGPTTTIQLDRPLEFDVANNAVLRVMSPTVKTGAAAIRDALFAAGVTKLGASFATLDGQDASAGLRLRLFIRKENKVKLTDHLQKILEMADLFLTVDRFGQVDVFRGLQFDGLPIFEEITNREIVFPVTIKYDRKQLYFAYDALYYSGGKVNVTSGQVSSDLLSQFAARDRWQPVNAQSEKPLDYQYLYESQAAGDFFGNRKISYNGRPRAQVTCALKQSPSGKPDELYNLSIGRKFLLTIDFGGGRALTRQPATVIAYSYDRSKQFYPQVTFELTNFLYPELAVPV